MKNCFVTVGTTHFPKLVNTITKPEVISSLKCLGMENIQIQTGQEFDKSNINTDFEYSTLNEEDNTWTLTLDANITIKYDKYFEDFDEQIRRADLVISHAGAGSCLDVLRQNKPLIVVVNEDLMNNHQMELARQLETNGHLYYSFCHDLSDTLKKDFSKLVPYPKPCDGVFSDYLDKCCGFVQ